MPPFLSNGFGRKFPGPGRKRSRGKTNRRGETEKSESEITRLKTYHLDRLPGKPPLLTVPMDSSVSLQEEANTPSRTSTP